MNRSREEVKKSATSTAIVKIDSRTEEADDYMHKLHKDLRTTTSYSYRRTNLLAYDAGKTRGSNIHLGASLGTGKAPKLLG